MMSLGGGECTVHQEEMSDQQKRLVKKRPLLWEAESSDETCKQAHLGPAVGALMSLLVNDRRHLGYLAAR
jgi:hypothetical protein